MKEITKTLLSRRSVRRYERKGIEPEKLECIYEAVRNTPTSFNGQQFSVIAVSDQETKIKLSEITSQKQIKTCAVFLVFCLDFHKLEIIGKRSGFADEGYHSTLDAYTVGVIDASLAMMSAVAAAESLGLGSCCIGYARTCAPETISEILGLPDKTAIVCGLSIGYPAEIPDIKPKLPRKAVIHDNRYTADIELLPLLEEYDGQIADYNRNRSGTRTENDWAGHILEYHREALNHGIEDYIYGKLGIRCCKLK